MSDNQFSLLTTKRFLPLFITQFLGAFHDNLFKSAMVAVLLFDAAGGVAQAGDQEKILVTLATAVFILPYVLFSALAGQYADKYSKDSVIRRVKMVEIAVAVLGAVALLSGSLVLSFLTLFALGAQSAFFNPSKFSILPQHLEDHELVGGNALIGVGTFLAILVGTIIGMTFINVPFGLWILSGLFIVSAVVGYLSSTKIPLAPSVDKDLKITYNIVAESYRIVSSIFTGKRSIIESALGIGWFWFMGSVFMSQMPNFTRLNLAANEHVSALFMVLFSVGIGVGGLFNSKLLRGRVEALYVPVAAVGVTIFAIDLFFAGRYFENNIAVFDAELMGLGAFLNTFTGWRIVVDVFLIEIGRAHV